jgi:hypothetical protein
MTVEFLQAAEDEAEEAFRFYEQRQPGLGATFRASLAMALTRVEKSPLATPIIGADFRKCRLRRFPYNLIYCVRADRVLIVALAHDRRRPGYWHSR